MAIPAILYVGVATQTFPIGAVFAVGGRHPSAVHRKIALWCCVLLLSDVIGLLAAEFAGSNLWLEYVAQPIEAGMTLWILATWQPSEVLRLAYMLSIPIMGAVIATLLLVTNPDVTYQLWIGPFVAILTLGAALHTLIHRSLLSRGLLTDQDWFWICLGLALFWVCYAPVAPFASAFLASHVDWVRRAYLARAMVMMGAFLLITWGIVCQHRRIRLSGSL